VAAINDLIRAAVTSRSPMPQFAYIAPFRSQAKSVAWDYLKHFSATAAATGALLTPGRTELPNTIPLRRGLVSPSSTNSSSSGPSSSSSLSCYSLRIEFIII
jgi:hypothetical protein